MTKAEVAIPEAAGLPAVQDMSDMYEPTTDVQSPSIYLMQGLSSAVKEQLAKAGDVCLMLGSDDTSPVHLIGGDSGADYFDAAILRRQVSYAIIDGADFTWLADLAAFNTERDAGSRDAWKVHRYIIAIPSVDAMLPARLMLTKTGGQSVAKALNSLIDRAAVDHKLAQVRFSVGVKTNRAGQQYHAFKVGATKLPDEDLAIAQAMQVEVQRTANQWRTENDAPTGPAVDQPSF